MPVIVVLSIPFWAAEVPTGIDSCGTKMPTTPGDDDLVATVADLPAHLEGPV
jgi:hypothetical protein